MAHAPRWKVYDDQQRYVASCKYVEHAAALVDFIGDGATIRDGHQSRHIVWTEGSEDQPAAESWDHVAEVAYQRRATPSAPGA